MKIIGKTIFVLLVLTLLIWQIPSLLRFACAKPGRSPFVLYSNVIGNFAIVKSDGDKNVYTDSKGNLYSEREFDSLLPAFYARQLYSEGRFPDSIQHQAVKYPQVVQHNFFFRSRPSDINQVRPRLYFLLEAMSGRVDLEMPGDAFRITTQGIEFIDMESNRVNEEKSRVFTDMMKSKGFVFPASYISGDPNARKDYDEGYVLTDREGKLFHLKMLRGTPYFRAVELPQGVVPEHLFITEFPSRATLALFTTGQHGLYALCMPGYQVKKIDIPSFDPISESLLVIGNMFDWTICISSGDTTSYYAVSAQDFSLLGQYQVSEPVTHIPGLVFTSSMDQWVRPRFK